MGNIQDTGITVPENWRDYPGNSGQIHRKPGRRQRGAIRSLAVPHPVCQTVGMRKKPGRKIVKGLFCAGVALSAVLCAPCASAKDEVVSADTKNLTVSSKVEGNVLAGGYTTDETVSGNKITIVSGAEIATYTDASGEHGGYEYGGLSRNGAVTDNCVEMTGGAVTKNLLGGYSAGSGAVSNNTVTLSDGEVSGGVYGGQSTGSGAVNSNTVTSLMAVMSINVDFFLIF